MAGRSHSQSTQQSQSGLNERAQHLLKVLIDRHIRDGQPVGSRSLAREARLDLSPATIRNVMADLEELGLVRAPHTSAGRVPTVKGYRFFVDSLLTVKPLKGIELFQLKDHFGEMKDGHGLLEKASSLLSDVTRMAGIVTVPRREYVALKQLHFLPLSEDRVLAVLVADHGEIQNRVFRTGRHYPPAELQEIGNYLTEKLAGKDLTSVRKELIRELEEAKDSMNRLMAEAIKLAERLFEDDASAEEDYVLAGQTNLMDFAELSSVETLRQLFETFNHKREILHLLDQCIRGEGLQIFIGEESGYEALDDCSVVTAPYSVDGRPVGVLGVIGPTRMAYERVIPIVDVTAKLLGAALNSRH